MHKLYRFVRKCILAWRALGGRTVLRSLLYARQRDHLDRGLPQTQPTDFRSFGAVVRATRLDQGVEFGLGSGALEVLVLAPDLLRVSWESVSAPVPVAVIRGPGQWPAVSFDLEEGAEEWRLRTALLQLQVRKEDGALTLLDARGRVLRQEDAPGRSGSQVRLRVRLAPEERIFGLGERAAFVDRRGKSWRFWNVDPAGQYELGDDPLYLNIPVSLHLQAQGRCVLAFFENSHPAVFDLGQSEKDVGEYRFEGGMLRYYLAVGSPAVCLERYTELTGRPSLPPLWALGYHQCRYSYYPEERVRRLAADFKRHQLPVDVIHLDIHYMDEYRVFTWDRDRFPDPARLATDLQQQGIRLVTIVDPGVLRDRNWPLYQSGLTKGVFCTLPDGHVLHAPVWPGWCAFPDFTDARARAWWGEQYRVLLEAGISGFWNDMNEPAAFAAWGEATLPLSTRHLLEGRGGDHREAHNLYGLGMAQAGFEGLMRLAPQKRPFFVSRSGWAGIQRYAWTWTGDCNSDWSALRLVVPMLLGLALSGVPLTGPDVGGFNGTPTPELYTRWFQLGAFLPFFRSHTVIGSPDQEPWSYGEPHLSIHREFLRLRYSLLPYLYTTVWQSTQQGLPVVRPLFWPTGEDARLWDVDDAFLLGDALLVAPILELELRQREVELPAGSWYELGSDCLWSGPGRALLDAPLESIPVLVRAGAVLGRTEPASSTSKLNFERLTLHLYLPQDEEEHLSWLYTDAGEGHDHQSGNFRLERLKLQRQENQLRLDWETQGSFPWPYRQILLEVHGLNGLSQVRVDGSEVGFFGRTWTVAGPFQQAIVEL